MYTTTSPSFISIDAFMSIVAQQLGKTLNLEQQRAVEADSDESLFLVAGPGSGKTTVLTLRVLKLIFVDGIEPDAILATTFTRRAAAELRSRILGWGDQIRHGLLTNASPAQRAWLRKLDLNQTLTGTLDSLAEQVLRDFRGAGMQPPVVLDEFIARALMFREGVLGTGAYGNQALKDYLARLCRDRYMSVQSMGAIVSEIRQRIIHDRVDRAQFRASQPPQVDNLFQIIDAYEQKLREKLALDFAMLEQQFLERLQSGALSRFTERLCAVLVDEYQDTNLLQESIYFEMAKAVRQRNGGITAVGDDDQSLYRFRGATVDLFKDFVPRLRSATGIAATTIYLNSNYRSTANIIDYAEKYLRHDPPYSGARVAGKPPLRVGRTGGINVPILAMFRPDLPILARDLAAFIADVAREGRVIVTPTGQRLTIRVDPSAGSVGDIALLCSSPREYSSSGRARLPLLIRQELEQTHRIPVFNPRGQEFSEIECVQQLCGLMLECIDPGGALQQNLVPRRIPDDISDKMNAWRAVARTFIASNPPGPGTVRAGRSHSLGDFVSAWQRRSPQERSRTWPEEVPLIDLLYKLLTWIPKMQEDPEGLVYLEAITRTITQSAYFSPFDAAIRRDPPFAQRSVEAAIRDIFAPLAAGEIDIDEDLLETIPRDRLNILSIHQSKGLEFPLVIVDVGSDFRTEHYTQRFRRFPDAPGRAPALEDGLRPSSPLGAPARSGLDRAFDDLIRLYFVAFSRPQDVLLLVGLGDPRRGPNRTIPNIALGWRRQDPSPGGMRWPLTREIVYL
ncbi:MAG: ATP-dependent helicase [Roseiflexus sp.]|nr:ATP-dependent helicase [Roseiflexus sp.]MDW8145909.1 ATP-dependent helicase [Roseiflexaceae bacterium]